MDGPREDKISTPMTTKKLTDKKYLCMGKRGGLCYA